VLLGWLRWLPPLGRGERRSRPSGRIPGRGEGFLFFFLFQSLFQINLKTILKSVGIILKFGIKSLSKQKMNSPA